MVARFTLMDDLYMVKFFEGQNRCVEIVLRAIMGIPDLEVVEVTVDREMVSLLSRSAELDVVAVDGQGRRYDIEVQRDRWEATPRRARFYASLLDSTLLEKGDAFDDLAECCVIFITDGDALGHGLPVYRIDRMILGTGVPFDDGSHVIFVNARYDYDRFMKGELGDVMHDFLCADPDQMRMPELAARARDIKTAEGADDMPNTSRVIFNMGLEQGLEQGREQGRAHGVEQGRAEVVASLVSSGAMTVAQVAQALGMPERDVERCVERGVAPVGA